MNTHLAVDAAAKLFSSQVKDIKIPEAVRERSSFWIAVYAAKPFMLIAAGYAAPQIIPDPLVAAPLVFLAFLAAQRHFQTLVHDASHYFYSRDAKRNDLLANWLAAGWIGMEIGRYRKIHMKHHAYNGSKEDPEHVSFATVGQEGGLLLMAAKYVLGFESLRLFAKYFIKTESASPKGAGSKGGMAGKLLGMTHLFGCQAGLLALSLAADMWWGYALWLYLAVTWNPLLSRLRFLAEHPGDDDTTVTTLAGILENSYFAPQSFNYHCEHHGWPMIPPYRLRRMHQFLRDEMKFYGEHSELISGSYIGKLLELAHDYHNVQRRSKA